MVLYPLTDIDHPKTGTGSYSGRRSVMTTVEKWEQNKTTVRTCIAWLHTEVRA